MPRFFGDIECVPLREQWNMRGDADRRMSFNVSDQQDSGYFCLVSLYQPRQAALGERQDHPSASDMHHTITGHTRSPLWHLTKLQRYAGRQGNSVSMEVLSLRLLLPVEQF
jgi:hypothetical protein